MMEARFRISVETTMYHLYSQELPTFPIPRVGEEVFVPGDGMGLWLVKEVRWGLPSPEALEPTMWVTIIVEWSGRNGRPMPEYDEDLGWIQKEPENAWVEIDGVLTAPKQPPIPQPGVVTMDLLGGA